MDVPHITVIIPAYDFNERQILESSIDSVLKQDYSSFDIVVITEGNKLTEYIKSNYKGVENVSTFLIDNNEGGISAARNEGIKRSDGDIIAYIDSDAIAAKNWLQSISDCYRNNDNIVAVGGKSEAKWLHTRPWYLPDEFLWLVGVTHKGHPPDGSIVRSTFGCNMSYKKEIFDNIDGFDIDLGKNHGFNLQGEEPELGIRIQKEYNTGVYYDSNAIVSHLIEEKQTRFIWLCKRAYLQGITKYIIQDKHKDIQLQTENNYLKYLFLNRLFYHFKSITTGKEIKKSIGSIIGILLFTFLVGMGYMRGFINKKLSI